MKNSQTVSENFMQEKFYFESDGDSLTLQGANNVIGALGVFAGTNGDTLILDNTSNNIMTTTIGNVVNGGNLIVDFKGGGQILILSRYTPQISKTSR